MPAENVEIVRSANDAFLSGDVETALGALDPEIEWHATVGGVDEGEVYVGRDAVVQAFADYFETWERIEMRADRYIDAGEKDVVVFHHEVAKGGRAASWSRPTPGASTPSGTARSSAFGRTWTGRKR